MFAEPNSYDRSEMVVFTMSLMLRDGSLGRRAPDERQQVAHDFSGANRFRTNLLEIAPQLGTFFGIDQQLGEAENRLQRVVQLVRDARHELADGRQPLAVNELAAQAKLFGDVALHLHVVRHLPWSFVSGTIAHAAWNVEPSLRRWTSVPFHAWPFVTFFASSSFAIDSSAMTAARDWSIRSARS